MMPPQSASVGHRLAGSKCDVTLDARAALLDALTLDK
jgi:hypothetical protein